MVVARGCRDGKRGDVVQRIQTSNYKINKFRGSKIQYGDYSYNTMLYPSKLLREQILNILTTTTNTEKVTECMCAQSCPTLSDLMDCSPPGPSVHGILQARRLEWVAIFTSRGFSQPRNWTWISYTAPTSPALQADSLPLNYQGSLNTGVQFSFCFFFTDFSGMAEEGWSIPFRDPRSCSLLCGRLVNLPLSNVPGARQTSRPIYLKLRLEVTDIWTFLVAQWLRILLPLQGPRVPFLLRKGSTCQGATKPMGHNDWTCTPEPMLCSKKSHCSPQLEKARAQQWSLSTAKNKHTHAQKKSELLHLLIWP